MNSTATKEVSLISDITIENKNPASRRAVAAAVLGNWLEYFDFGVYAIFAVMIGKVFFPVESTSGQLMLALGTFGVGFLMRPLGAIVLGSYADRVGRKAALTLTMMLMALGTGMIGLTPSYEEIGLAAPILIIIARLIQGFSAGGEAGAATTYLVEVAPAGRRGLLGSWQSASQGLATLAASLMGFGLTQTLSSEDLTSWGWRVPFILGMLIGPVGFYIRRHMHETAPSDKDAQNSAGVLKTLLADHLGLMLIGIMTVMGASISVYIIGKYMTTYAIHTLHMPASIGMLASVVSGIVMFIFSLVGGWLSDIYGRRVVMIAPRVLLVLAVLPAFQIITAANSVQSLLGVIAVLALLQAMSGAVGLVALPECFPRRVRTTGLSLIYGIGVSLFGGTSHLVATWLLDRTGDPMALAWYLIVANVISIAAFTMLRPPKAHEELK